MMRFPGQKARLSAAELNRQNETADRVAFGRRGMIDEKLPDDQQSHWVWIRNDSGEDRHRFDCMSLGDPLFEMLDDGTVDLLFAADDADPDLTPVILLEPIADGAFGKGVIHGMALAKVGAGSGLTAAPDATNHRLTPGGDIKLLAAPDASAVKLLPVLLGGGGEASGHFLFTLTGTITSGAGAATIRNMADDTEIASGASVKDPLSHFDGLTTGYRGVCVKSDGQYYAIGPYTTKVRWDDPDLEYSRGHSSTWLPVDTAEDCS